MSSHDPLVFSRLKRPQVRIFRRDGNGYAIAEEPLHDPQGMGIQAILASDLFRLRSGGLDSETQHDLDRQRQLSLKKDLSAEEEIELRKLTDRLNDLGFWKTARDPLYQLFLEKWTKREKPEWIQAVELTPEQLRQREALAAEITAEIAAERGDGA